MNIKSSALKFIITLFLLASFSLENSYATPEYGAGRLRTCDGDGNVEGLDFDPTTGGDDVNFALSNPVCVSVIATSYAAVKGAIALMNAKCGSGSSVPRVIPSPILDARDIAKAGVKAAGSREPSCIAAWGAATLALNAAIIELGIIHAIAEDVFDNSHVCGANWTKSNPNSFDMNTPFYKNTVESHVRDIVNGDPAAWTALSLEGTGSEEDQKKYREWYYGGVEVEDNPDEGETCYDPTVKGNPKQKYYLRGLGAGNYNCEK